MRRRYELAMLSVGGAIIFGGLMYVAGWRSGAAAAQPPVVSAVPAQTLPGRPEIIPFPTPNRLGPDQGQGQDCQPVILFYYQGRLYQLMPGPDNQPGLPGSPPEYFPLRPYQGPQIPGLPFGPMPSPLPQGPGFQPTQPRF